MSWARAEDRTFNNIISSVFVSHTMKMVMLTTPAVANIVEGLLKIHLNVSYQN